MEGSSKLLHDLAIILITAGIVTVIFKLIKQPVVLGYIVAGFLISPNFVFLPSVVDAENINAWADIGVIFLLFTLGLDFSLKKLMAVGGTAFIGTSINMIGMIAIGHTLGQMLGWGNGQSLFLGCMLSMSSTTIIIKTLTDMDLSKKRFASIVFGMLVVEDLGTILIMVLLPTVAISQNFSGSEFLNKILMLVFFILIWFIGGTYIIPPLFRIFRKYLNEETLLVVSIGLCLGMVLFATSVGFSSALGAFLMGSILSETVDFKRIETIMQPVKNLFAAIFFVSVGMMIVPSVILQYAPLILILAAVFIVCRFILSTSGILISGENLKVAVQSGLCLTQIGEFSFIIATLGIKLKVLSDFLYPVIVCVAVITMFVSPNLIKSSETIYNGIIKLVPSRWTRIINGYSAANTTKNINNRSIWSKVLKDVIITIVIYFTLALATYLISEKFIMPVINNILPNTWGAILSASATIILMAPFINSILRRHTKTADTHKLWEDSYFNKGALIALNLIRILPCIVLILMVLVPLFPRISGVLLILAVTLIIIFALWEGFSNRSARMEKHFFDNLNSNEIMMEKSAAISKDAKNEMLNKNLHLTEIDIPQNSGLVGKTLSEINLKQVAGVDIISIIRGTEKINIPGGKVQVFPFDKLVIAGTDEEIQKFEAEVEKRTQNASDQSVKHENQHKIEISQYMLKDNSPLIGMHIKDSNIKEKAHCAIIGIDRSGKSLDSFGGDTLLNSGDILWLAGEKANLKSFEQQIAS